jgi:hypothetical protein
MRDAYSTGTPTLSMSNGGFAKGRRSRHSLIVNKFVLQALAVITGEEISQAEKKLSGLRKPANGGIEIAGSD